MAKDKYFQISTAIDYPSGKFHLGHAYEKICTDTFARWKRLQGYKVHFSTGTDCHGLKIQRAAKKAGKTPEKFVNEISNGFKELCNVLNISYDDFIMTTEDRHKKVVKKILLELESKGYVYKGNYEGLYCVDCETYYTEKDLVEGNCPVHKKPVENFKEESYFFKLSKFQKKLIDNISKDLVWPKKKQKEILNRLKVPLKDLSISRKQVEWGIPLPFEKDMTVFVWVEALMNYLTTVNYPNKKFKDFWPATHFIGSDIVWHHIVIWYSILLALGLELPNVIVHGFINLKGEKLSKATGVTVDPIELAKKYSTDSLRYFLLRKIPFGDDGDFLEEALREVHNNELANKLGNLVSRVSSLIEKNGIEKTENKLHLSKEWEKLIKEGKAEIEVLEDPKDANKSCHTLKIKGQNDIKRGEPFPLIISENLGLFCEVTKVFVEKHFKNYELDKVLNEIFKFIDHCNWFVQIRKLWETDCKNREKDLDKLRISILEIAKLLSPFMPESSEKIIKQFSAKKIKKEEVLFKKI